MDTRAKNKVKLTAEGDWKRELINLLHLKGRVSHKGKVKPVSNRTLKSREDILFMCINQVKQMGFDIQSIYSLRSKHIDRLVERWKEDGIEAGTIQNRLAILRLLAKWIGKDGMVLPTKHYSMEDPERLKRTVAARTDKSWSAKNISSENIIEEATKVDRYVGIQLKVMHAFGLRREEAIQFKPYKVHEGDIIRVRDGTKGGRERVVTIDSDYQRLVLEEAKMFVRRWDGSLGNPERDLVQNIDRFNYIMKKLGVTKKGLGITSHGLRHQRLNDVFEEIAGVPSPVRQMDLYGQVVITPENKDLWNAARQKVSNTGGHARLSIATAYTGSSQSVKKQPVHTGQDNESSKNVEKEGAAQPGGKKRGQAGLTWTYQIMPTVVQPTVVVATPRTASPEDQSAGESSTAP